MSRAELSEFDAWRLDQVAKLVMEVRHQKRKVFWYRLALGIAIGIDIVRWLS